MTIDIRRSVSYIYGVTDRGLEFSTTWHACVPHAGVPPREEGEWDMEWRANGRSQLSASLQVPHNCYLTLIIVVASATRNWVIIFKG